MTGDEQAAAVELLAERGRRAAEELLAEERERAPAVAELAAEVSRRAELLLAHLRAAAEDKEGPSAPLR